MRRKKRPKLEMLTKSTAAAYEGPEAQPAVPDTVIAEESEMDDTRSVDLYVKPQRGSFIRRSFSFRRDRASRSRSPAAPPVPTKSVLTGMTMHTLEAEKEKLQAESAKYAVLSKRHLENLDLGAASFETCLSIDGAKKVSTTFLASTTLKVRPISPLPDFTSRREIPSPRLSKLVTNGFDSPHKLHVPRLVPVSGRVDMEVTPPLKSRSSANSSDRPASSTPPVDPASGQTTMTGPASASPRSLTQSPLFPVGEPSLMTTKPTTSSNISRPKPKRPAPPRPPHAEYRKSSAGESGLAIEPSSSSSPIPAQVGGGIISPLEHTRRATPPMVEVHERSEDVAIAPSLAIPVPPPPPPIVPPGVASLQEAVMQSLADREQPQPVSNPQPVSKPQPASAKARPPLVRKDSLYISPLKLHRRQSKHKLNIDQLPTLLSETDDSNKRASQILKAAGVESGSLADDRVDLLVAIRTGIQLKKVEQEEKDRQNATTPWDVAAILERRRAMELESDDSEIEDGDFDEDWED